MTQTATKYDQKKLRLDLLPPRLLITLAFEPREPSTRNIAYVTTDLFHAYLLGPRYSAVSRLQDLCRHLHGAMADNGLDALVEVARVLEYGTNKYDSWNWLKGMQFSRLEAAAKRHIFLGYLRGEKEDPETGISHLAHALANIGFLMHYLDHGLGEDDRPR